MLYSDDAKVQKVNNENLNITAQDCKENNSKQDDDVDQALNTDEQQYPQAQAANQEDQQQQLQDLEMIKSPKKPKRLKNLNQLISVLVSQTKQQKKDFMRNYNAQVQREESIKTQEERGGSLKKSYNKSKSQFDLHQSKSKVQSSQHQEQEQAQSLNKNENDSKFLLNNNENDSILLNNKKKYESPLQLNESNKQNVMKLRNMVFGKTQTSKFNQLKSDQQNTANAFTTMQQNATNLKIERERKIGILVAEDCDSSFEYFECSSSSNSESMQSQEEEEEKGQSQKTQKNQKNQKNKKDQKIKFKGPKEEGSSDSSSDDDDDDNDDDDDDDDNDGDDGEGAKNDAKNKSKDVGKGYNERLNAMQKQAKLNILAYKKLHPEESQSNQPSRFESLAVFQQQMSTMNSFKSQCEQTQNQNQNVNQNQSINKEGSPHNNLLSIDEQNFLCNYLQNVSLDPSITELLEEKTAKKSTFTIRTTDYFEFMRLEHEIYETQRKFNEFQENKRKFTDYHNLNSGNDNVNENNASSNSNAKKNINGANGLYKNQKNLLQDATLRQKADMIQQAQKQQSNESRRYQEGKRLAEQYLHPASADHSTKEKAMSIVDNVFGKAKMFSSPSAFAKKNNIDAQKITNQQS